MAEVLRIRSKTLGGHVHTRLFMGPSADQTLQSLGSLVMDLEQWDLLRAVLSAGGQRFPEDITVEVMESS